MDAEYAVLTAVGKDRVGIVGDLSALVSKAGCNIEESRMAVLGGEFAIVMLVSGGPKALGELEKDAQGAGSGPAGPGLGLHIQTRRTTPPRAEGEGRPYLLESVSLDAPGIVYAVTELLRGYRVNIEDMETETTSAPWTGAPMFRMRAHVIVPSGVVIAELRRELEALEHDRDLDISLKPASSPSAEG